MEEEREIEDEAHSDVDLMDIDIAWDVFKEEAEEDDEEFADMSKEGMGGILEEVKEEFANEDETKEDVEELKAELQQLKEELQLAKEELQDPEDEEEEEEVEVEGKEESLEDGEELQMKEEMLEDEEDFSEGELFGKEDQDHQALAILPIKEEAAQDAALKYEVKEEKDEKDDEDKLSFEEAVKVQEESPQRQPRQRLPRRVHPPLPMFFSDGSSQQPKAGLRGQAPAQPIPAIATGTSSSSRQPRQRGVQQEPRPSHAKEGGANPFKESSFKGVTGRPFVPLPDNRLNVGDTLLVVEGKYRGYVVDYVKFMPLGSPGKWRLLTTVQATGERMTFERHQVQLQKRNMLEERRFHLEWVREQDERERWEKFQSGLKSSQKRHRQQQDAGGGGPAKVARSVTRAEALAQVKQNQVGELLRSQRGTVAPTMPVSRRELLGDAAASLPPRPKVGKGGKKDQGASEAISQRGGRRKNSGIAGEFASWNALGSVIDAKMQSPSTEIGGAQAASADSIAVGRLSGEMQSHRGGERRQGTKDGRSFKSEKLAKLYANIGSNSRGRRSLL